MLKIKKKVVKYLTISYSLLITFNVLFKFEKYTLNSI